MKNKKRIMKPNAAIIQKSRRGPKPKEDNDLKEPVQVYITKGRIKELGGIEEARSLTLAILQNTPIQTLKILTKVE